MSAATWRRRRSPAWTPGDTIVYRERWRGHVLSGLPLTVVDDGPEATLAYRPPRVDWYACRPRSRERELWSHDILLDTLAAHPQQRTLVPLVSSPQHSLIMHPVGASMTVRLAWTPEWKFLEWYVNLELPWTYGDRSVESMDHLLDIVVDPDFRWRLKDLGDLAAAVRRGLFSPDDAAHTLSEARRVVEMIERREAPFDAPWPAWRADPSWARPTLPPDWDRTGSEAPTATHS